MREILFEYGFESVNGIIKKVYSIGEIPNIAKKCDVWNVLPIVYVRQFTGLTDKNGVKIFDGDKLKYKDGHYGVVEYSTTGGMVGWIINFKKEVPGRYWGIEEVYAEPTAFEVIGNIHD